MGRPVGQRGFSPLFNLNDTLTLSGGGTGFAEANPKFGTVSQTLSSLTIGAGEAVGWASAWVDGVAPRAMPKSNARQRHPES